MRKTLTAALFVLGFAAPLLAHHPFASEYDWKKPATLTGIISKVEWMVPHVQMIVDGTVDPAYGTRKAKWTVELASPNELRQLGWKLTQLKIGDPITIDGWLGHVDDNHMMNAKSVHLADGSELSAGSSFFNIAPTPAVASAARPKTHVE
jgi:hypothetical protein